MDSMSPGLAGRGGGGGRVRKSPRSLMASLLWEQERRGSWKVSAPAQGHTGTQGRRQELEAPSGGGESQGSECDPF